ncbi:hypothetical protein ACE38W_15035 [Chitinophaga sp. Hz27]|uniref:hypothetical protein n=1 Tax=Chitinophaga sp. Hz27 TaxID=3347169 RepID=UPI0035DAED15
MAETKIGLSQVERPAPLWYRRLSNAIIFVTPAIGQLVSTWGLPDSVVARWLSILTFIPAAVKGIGLMLGNGQNYTDASISNTTNK